jgi:hypothetical protein
MRRTLKRSSAILQAEDGENWPKRRPQSKLPAPGTSDAIYHPPEVHFDDPAEYRRYLQTAAQQAGGAIPDPAVSAEPVEIAFERRDISGLPFNCQLSTVNYPHE